MRKISLGLCGGVAVAILACLAWPSSPKEGQARFFADDTYNFETVRVASDITFAGGDSGEIADAVPRIKSGDNDSWYQAWNAAAGRAAAVAGRTNDPRSKGYGLLRASNYYRAAEFFLEPTSPRRKDAFDKSVSTFYEGLDALKVNYQRIVVPYGDAHLKAVYYPGGADAEKRPLLVVVGGYDSTLEELYFSIAAAGLERGYSVLTYEGPGQGSILREQGVHMVPNWEKPNGAVLDEFLRTHPAPRKIVLIGESLGGYLAPRAAAFDSRIDGVVAYDVWYDGFAIASRKVPKFVFWLHDHGYDRILEALSSHNSDTGARWATENGKWVFGLQSSIDVLENFRLYTIAPVAERIHQDVLLLAGENDHFVPIEQLDEEKRSLTHARSVTAVSFDAQSGGALHCQLGAPTLLYGTLFDWLANKYPIESSQAAPTSPKK